MNTLLAFVFLYPGLWLCVKLWRWDADDSKKLPRTLPWPPREMGRLDLTWDLIKIGARGYEEETKAYRRMMARSLLWLPALGVVALGFYFLLET